MAHLGALVVAAFAALAGAGAAQAAPTNLGNTAPSSVTERDGAMPAYYGYRNCWPVRRWVWTYWGWRPRIVGYRCAPNYYRYDYYPQYRPHYW